MNPNKFYQLKDIEGFKRKTGANHAIARILLELGPFKPVIDICRNVVSSFGLKDGRVFTESDAEREYGFEHAFHVTEEEMVSYFEEVPSQDEDERVFVPEPPMAIPEIRLTITTMEEVRAAIIMLQGLQDANV